MAISTCAFMEISGAGTPGVEYGFDIYGRNVNNDTEFGIYLGKGSTDIEVHHAYIHDCGTFIVAKTLQSCAAPQWLEDKYVMRNVSIHHIKGRNSAFEGFYIGNTNYFWNDGSCTNLKTHWIENLQVYECDLENMGNDGIQISVTRDGDNRIHNNRLVNYATNGVDSHGYGILCGGGSTLKIYNNYISKGFMPAVTIFGSGTQEIYNNLITDIKTEGIVVYDKIPAGVDAWRFPAAVARIYNNTIHKVDQNRDGIKVYAYLTTQPHQIYNNLLLVNGAAGDYPSSGIYAKGDKLVLVQAGNNLQFSDITQAKLANPDGGDYRPTSVSPVIDKGANISAITFDLDEYSRPVNGVFDVGAYEYRDAPDVNIPPVAKAGPDQTIKLPENTATLDGSASTDADGRITGYNWSKVSGPAGGEISDPAAIKPVLTALGQGTYVYRLQVTDDQNATAADEVTITVQAATNEAPWSNAGPDQTIQLPISSVTLDGSLSVDNDGTFTFAWAKISGPAGGAISNVAVAKPVVSGLQAGTYILSLPLRITWALRQKTR